MEFYRNGQSDTVVVVITDSNDDPVTGATVNLSIRRLSDNQYFNGSTWQVGATTVSMPEVGSTGQYEYDFAGIDDDTVVYTATTAEGTAEIKRFTSTARWGRVDVTAAQVTTAVLGADPTTYAKTTTIGGYINIIKKYARNKLIFSGATKENYEVKEDDGTTEFESGTSTEDGRTPS